MSSSRLLSGGLSTLPGSPVGWQASSGRAPLPLLITVAIQLSEKTNSPYLRLATRLCNSRHPAINRGAPLPVAGIVATDGAEVRILQPQGDRPRPAGADRAPVHLDDGDRKSTRLNSSH